MEDKLNILAGEFTRAIPHLFGGLVVLGIGYLVARTIKSIVSLALSKAGLDKVVDTSPAGKMIHKVAPNISNAIGALTFWAIFLGAISLAVSVLGIQALTDFVAAIYTYLPNVIAAFLILLVAGLTSAAISGFVGRVMGETSTGKMVAGVVPGVIFSIAIFMVLSQLQIAPTIVTITYAAIMGSIALGSALAFGLGGREVAASILGDVHDRAGKHIGQVKEDLALGKAHSKELVKNVQQASAQQSPLSTHTKNFASAPAFGERMQSFQDSRPGEPARDSQE